MTKEQLHTFLTTHFDLVVDAAERGGTRTYFLAEVVWRPSATTRILHVQYGADDCVSHIRLCVSSDNNNSVFVSPTIGWQGLRQTVADEISQHVRRKASVRTC